MEGFSALKLGHKKKLGHQKGSVKFVPPFVETYLDEK